MEAFVKCTTKGALPEIDAESRCYLAATKIHHVIAIFYAGLESDEHQQEPWALQNPPADHRVVVMQGGL